MKKLNLFKVVMLALLTVLLLTWIIPASSYDGMTLVKDGFKPVPFLDLFANIFDTVGFFAQVVVFALVVGGFYGVLNTTDAYSSLMQKVAKIAKGKEKIAISIIIVLFAILGSVINLSFTIFAFVPMFVTLLILLGYDKITSMTATIGAIIVGIIGSTLGYSLVGNINVTLGLEVMHDLVARLVILIFGIALLIFYVHYKGQKLTAKDKKEEENYDPMYVEVKKPNDKIVGLSIILGTIFVSFVLGFISWFEIFKIEIFNNLHNSFMELNILSYPITNNLFGGISAFGNWGYSDISVVLVIASLIIALIYKVKLNEYLISFFEGVKKLLPTSGIIILALSVLVLSNANSYNAVVGISPAILDFFLGMTGNFDLSFFFGIPTLLAFTIPTMLVSIINVDPYYFVQFNLTIVKTIVSEPTVNPLMGLMFQTMYGFAQLFAPTSIILLAGLSYLDIPYIKWLKFIKTFLLFMFIVIITFLTVIMVMI